jgi:hypothetical protein
MNVKVCLNINYYIFELHNNNYFQGVTSVLDHYYSGSIAKGLMDMFPDIGLVRTEFRGMI